MTDYDCIYIHSNDKYYHDIVKMLNGDSIPDALEEVCYVWWESSPIERHWYGKLFCEPYHAMFQYPDGSLLKLEHMYQNHFKVTLLDL